MGAQEQRESHKVELTIEFMVGLITFAYPFGAEQMDLPHNFWIGLGSWAVCVAIVIRVLWILPWLRRIPRPLKAASSFGLIGLFIWVVWTPVHKQLITLCHTAIQVESSNHSCEEPATNHISTSLRLQFFGDTRYPTEVRSENVYRWYVLWNSIRIAEGDSVLTMPRSWIIFVTFTKPTVFRELTVGFTAPGFPSYEVKDQTQRYAIISISGDVPAGELEIFAKP